MTTRKPSPVPGAPRLLKASAGMKREYCAKVVRVGRLLPVEGADGLERTTVDGYGVVVRRGTVKEGDVVIYCMTETQLNPHFLAANNQYEYAERHRNANRREVEALASAGRTAEAHRMTGFMNKHGRVKLIMLRGCPSYGVIYTQADLARWIPSAARERLEGYLVTDADGVEHAFDFDTVGHERFAWAYVPSPTPARRRQKELYRNRRLNRFERLVPGQFSFHYDTQMLQSNIWRLRPGTPVTVSVKMHGTSAIIANVLTRVPAPPTVVQRKANRQVMRRLRALARQKGHRSYSQRAAERSEAARLESRLHRPSTVAYGSVAASRTVIKTRRINPAVPQGFYKGDIWNEYARLLSPFLDPGMTLYGELCGYASGSGLLLQPCYDYGCQPGCNFIMPYRITLTAPDGSRTEWGAMRVHRWTLRLLRLHPELQPRLRPLEVLYHGTFGNLYPDLDRHNHWNTALLNRIQHDNDTFGMEADEPLCRNSVPREGIVVRIDSDSVPEAFKLKTTGFLLREAEFITRVSHHEADLPDEMRAAYAKPPAARR